MAEKSSNAERRAKERRTGERREDDGIKPAAKFEFPTIILNTGFILVLQLMVIIAFCK